MDVVDIVFCVLEYVPFDLLAPLSLVSRTFHGAFCREFLWKQQLRRTFGDLHYVPVCLPARLTSQPAVPAGPSTSLRLFARKFILRHLLGPFRDVPKIRWSKASGGRFEWGVEVPHMPSARQSEWFEEGVVDWTGGIIPGLESSFRCVFLCPLDGTKRLTIEEAVEPPHRAEVHVLSCSFCSFSDSGAVVSRVDLASNDVIWEKNCKCVRVDHSEYEHHVQLSVWATTVHVSSVGSYGSFLEILDLQTGECLSRTGSGGDFFRAMVEASKTSN